MLRSGEAVECWAMGRLPVRRYGGHGCRTIRRLNGGSDMSANSAINQRAPQASADARTQVDGLHGWPLVRYGKGMRTRMW